MANAPVVIFGRKILEDVLHEKVRRVAMQEAVRWPEPARSLYLEIGLYFPSEYLFQWKTLLTGHGPHGLNDTGRIVYYAAAPEDRERAIKVVLAQLVSLHVPAGIMGAHP